MPLQKERIHGKSAWAPGLIQNASGVNGACTDFSDLRLCPVMKGAREYSTETILNITDFSTGRSTRIMLMAHFLALLPSCLR